MRISLRPGQRLFLNGAVIRVDHKVTFTLLNDATFLLDNHILQAHETTTPLRQLYFVIQTMLIDPDGATAARRLFVDMHMRLKTTFKNDAILKDLEGVAGLVDNGRSFEALRKLRNLFEAESRILESSEQAAFAA
ncbi:flagellar biosynthesis repressor FlbT [Afifella marina]|nr:flagellar biosynthesis repressor FlbT [Afifella marina]MBK1622020.1 flagellar biosynthesis repressor FlbT [Afifella marina DSM 2698]MBK1627813.1 flagellar biosynthesis repressor FlbT [Afifella marina]MBK5916780.1 flagellar biosynthesis repressor FlbT [Afifella marina]RAI19894.1 flagellar biosynthesis repressor FlbT [Afifella marina DSM 2698]